MEKSDFVREVSCQIEDKSRDCLKKLIINFARLMSQDGYGEALALLDDDEGDTPFDENADLLAAAKLLSESVEAEEYRFSWGYDSEYYDDYHYNDYYHDDYDETLYDHDGLGPKVDELLEACVRCVKKKQYEKALPVFDELFSMTIPSEDYDPIDIASLFDNSLMSVDHMRVLRCYAYAALMVLRGIARVEKLFEIIESAGYKLKLQDIADVGADRIPECAEFNKEWTGFLLKKQMMYWLEPMLIDAVIFSGGIEALRDFAKGHGAKCQTAYVELTKAYILEKNFDAAIGSALEGLCVLIGINKNRTELSDLLLELGNAKDDRKLIERAVWEGFKSSVDLKHFISLYKLNDENLRSQAVTYLIDNGKKDAFDYNYILFLNGSYDLVWENCNKDKMQLGWSDSKKGKMIPLFTALLAGQKEIPPVIKRFIGYSASHDSFDDFIEVLAQSLKNLQDADYKKYYGWCVKEAEGRVAAIVLNQHRGSYYKASALIVSLAEAIQSKSDYESAVNFIKSYKEKYPKHSSFRKCLLEDAALGNFSLR